MARNPSRAPSFIAFAAALAVVLLPPAASAQVHAHGSGWLHRGAGYGTMIHAYRDSLCTLGFPAACHGGMMGPDSLLCTFRSVPPDSMPHPMGRYCPVALRCEIRGRDGQLMMPGHMTPMGLFQRPIELTFHYDPAVMAAGGIALADLVVTTWADGAYTIVAAATHDVGSSVFRVSSARLAEWYGLADRSALPTAVEHSSWGQIKVTFR